MGDRVIKSLSRLLQKRSRKTDSIGRYGGEEFAIIFWDADVEAASKILDEIRADFARIDHHFESKVFSCTFSAGIAGFPDYPDGQAIGNAADRALYVAKRGGRNQVIIASD
jgi:diguanylate cyclase (GGDEF)-like protein